MTPKEKAEDLFNRIWSLSDMGKSHAKDSALIAVDEITDNARMQYSGSDSPVDNELFIDSEYWENVKRELEKL